MADFRRRFAEVQDADTARTRLIEDLITKIHDMEKMQERDSFVLVLIDGDGMNVSILQMCLDSYRITDSHSSSMIWLKRALPAAKKLPSVSDEKSSTSCEAARTFDTTVGLSSKCS